MNSLVALYLSIFFAHNDAFVWKMVFLFLQLSARQQEALITQEKERQAQETARQEAEEYEDILRQQTKRLQIEGFKPRVSAGIGKELCPALNSRLPITIIERGNYWPKQFKPWKVPTMVVSIVVVGVLTCGALILSVCDLKVT